MTKRGAVCLVFDEVKGGTPENGEMGEFSFPAPPVLITPCAPVCFQKTRSCKIKE
jgi:hypothetical protein